MAPPKSDLPQGTLDLLMLKVIALGPVHGYAIAQRLEQVSRGVVQVPEGSLYPALHRLENRGLLAADWKETETGREAKFYRLTRKGLKQLETETADWQRLIDAIGLILGMADGGAQYDRKVVPRRSLAGSRMVRGIRHSAWITWNIGLAPAAPASVRRQYSLALPLSTQFSAPCLAAFRKRVFSTVCRPQCSHKINDSQT